MSQPSSTLSGDPFRQSGATSRATGAKSVLRATVTVILWIIIVGMGFVKTLRWCGGNFNAEASGYLIGSVLTPALLALLVMWLVNRGRREKGPIEHRHVAVAGLAFVVSLLSFAGSQTQGGPSGASIRDQVRHLVRQGAGKEAEVNANWYDEPTRDFYRDIVTFNQEYVEAVHSVDQTPLKQLYHPESDAAKKTMQNTIASLQALQEIDKKYESIQALVKELEERVSAAKGSGRQKDDFLRGVGSSLAKSMAPRNDTFRAEEVWLQSSIDLYEFTVAHVSEYRVRQQKVIFRSEATLAEFNKLQSKSIGLHKSTLEAKHKLDSVQQQHLSQMGLTKADIVGPQESGK